MSESDLGPIFVAAPSQDAYHVAERLLRAADLEPISVSLRESDAGMVGGPIANLAARSSGALAVVPKTGISPNVAYEIGVAIGAGLPVVMLQLISKDESPIELPTDLRSLSQIRWDAAETPSKALTTRLYDLFTVQSPPAGMAPRVAPDKKQREFADEAERRVADALASVADSVMPQGPGNAVGVPDLAAWIAELPNWANPVLVEVKGRDSSGQGRGRAIEQFRSYMTDGRIALGLLVVPGLHDVEWHSQSGTAIALLGIETLERLPREDVVALLMRGHDLVASNG